MIALLTITPIARGQDLVYFFEYKEEIEGEVGFWEDGTEYSAAVDKFRARAKAKEMDLIVKSLPIQKADPVIIEAVGEPEIEEISS